ncbi:MAG: radical SAM protein [Patescibacteria group bacterium]
MRDKTAAISKATDALLQLGIPDVLPKLREAEVFVKRFILGGSHSVVTYPPLNALQKVKTGDAINDFSYHGESSLYVHIAFCETLCTFCHYAVKTYRGKNHSSTSRTEQVERYLQSLKVEIQEWGSQLRSSETVINSIYIGGGTPLILESNQLVAIINTIRREFHIKEDVEICMEASPLTITAPGGYEKLQILKKHGVTRISFGIQSFDDEVLKRAARGYKQDTAILACELVGQVFDNWNLDLIQSLYKGTLDEVWQNLNILRIVRPPQLTWYHGRFAKRPQGEWYKNPDKKGDFEGEYDTLVGRMLLWQELTDMGYRQVDGNRFVLDDRHAMTFNKILTSTDSNLLGVGASSYSHVSVKSNSKDSNVYEGVLFRNTPDINAYIEHMENGGKTIDSALKLDQNEYLARSYVIGMRKGKLAFQSFEGAAHESVSHYQKLEMKFLELGLLNRYQLGIESGIRLSTLGLLFEDEVLSMFYSPKITKYLDQSG